MCEGLLASREIYTVALKMLLWPLGIARTIETQVRKTRNSPELPFSKWNCAQSFLVPTWQREIRRFSQWSLIARDPTAPWNGLLFVVWLHLHLGRKDQIWVNSCNHGYRRLSAWNLMHILLSSKLVQLFLIFLCKHMVKWSHMKCLRKRIQKPHICTRW